MGGSSSTGTKPQKLTTISVQTSSYGICMGLAWGTARVTGNLLWYGDFVGTEHTEEQGGKGGGVSSTSYSYKAAFALGLAECEVVDIPRVWAAKDKTTLSALGLDLLNGYAGQAPWSYLTSKHPTEALNYPDLAYVAAAGFDLGSTASLPNLAFELVTSSAGVCGTPDAAPWAIVTDLLNLGGFPVARIGSMTTYTDYCGAHGLFLSPALTEQKRAAEHVQDILDMTHTAAVASEGVLKLVPYGDTAATANGYTFTPTVAPIYDLSDDDFLGLDGNLPIRIKRKAQSDAKNRLLIEFKDRSREYATNTAPAFDEAHIAEFGERPAETVQYDAIKDANVAAQVAFLKLQRGLYVLNTYEFRVGWRYCLLEPMDILTLTHSLLGLNRLPVRIVSVEEDIDGALTITAEDFPQGAGLAPKVTPQPPNGYSTDANIAPGDAASPVIFEPSAWLSGSPELWLATSGGPMYGGCAVWVSLDGVTYKQVGELRGGSRYGVTTAPLAQVADPDTTSTLAVDLSVSGGALISGTADDRDLYQTLCWINGELVSFQGAALAGVHAYSLTSLRRGAYGTVIASHPSGSQFVRCDDQVFRYPYDPTWIGKTLRVKLQAYNIFGGARQDLALLPAYSYTLSRFVPQLPTPRAPAIYCTPDSAGHISRAKARVSFDSPVNIAVTGLCFFVAAFPFRNAVQIAAGGTGNTLVMDTPATLSSGSLPILAGSTASHVVTTTTSSPNDVTWNGGGRYWARLPGGEWAKCTGIDAVGYFFNPPLDGTPVPGQALEWVEIAWADERYAGEYKLAVLSDGADYEIIRWASLDDNGPSGAIRVTGCMRGQEGTSVINADGATMHYLPAVGPGTSIIDFPASAFTADGSTYTADTGIDFDVPAGHYVSLSAAIYYQMPTGDFARSVIVPAVYGGPL